MIGDLRLNTYFNVRFEPGLYFSKRELEYPNVVGFENETDKIREIKSTYIHLPLILKVSAKRINNFRPFVMAGFSTDFNLSSNNKNRDDNASNVFRTTAQNLNYELGLGFDFYFTDQTTLKTIVRSNPAILILAHGTITQKRHYNDFELLEFNTTN